MGTLNDYRDRPHWSYSAVNQFFNICSLQFAFQRIYKIHPAFTPVALAFGSVFHRVAEWMFLTLKEGKIPEAKSASDLFNELWQRQQAENDNIRFDEEITAETCAIQGRDLVACLAANIDPTEKVLAVNMPFAVPLIDMQGNVLEVPMIGELDYVVEKEGKPIIGDWKSAARRWPKFKAKHDLQPTVFLYAYRQLTGIMPGFRFDVVVKNKTPVFERHETERTDSAFHRMVELVKLAEDMVQHEHFCPNEQGFYCGSCPYHGACDNWHQNYARHISLAA